MFLETAKPKMKRCLITSRHAAHAMFTLSFTVALKFRKTWLKT